MRTPGRRVLLHAMKVAIIAIITQDQSQVLFADEQYPILG
jgi:hypothetical protein